MIERSSERRPMLPPEGQLGGRFASVPTTLIVRGELVTELGSTNRSEEMVDPLRINEVLGDRGMADLVAAVSSRCVQNCIAESCKFVGKLRDPYGLLPGPNKHTGSPGYYPENANSYTITFECTEDGCPNPNIADSAMSKVHAVDRTCSEAWSKLSELQEPLLDEAEAARDAVLARAQEEASEAYFAVYSRIEAAKEDIFGEVRRAILD